MGFGVLAGGLRVLAGFAYSVGCGVRWSVGGFTVMGLRSLEFGSRFWFRFVLCSRVEFSLYGIMRHLNRIWRFSTLIAFAK